MSISSTQTIAALSAVICIQFAFITATVAVLPFVFLAGGAAGAAIALRPLLASLKRKGKEQYRTGAGTRAPRHQPLCD